MDEIHTPDCSRFWDADDYATATKRGDAPKHFDKEFVRRELERLGVGPTGDVPELDRGLRLDQNLKRYFARTLPTSAVESR
jgi:phosphoribosylaminoimidazole-succinocarboxamide synthase